MWQRSSARAFRYALLVLALSLFTAFPHAGLTAESRSPRFDDKAATTTTSSSDAHPIDTGPVGVHLVDTHSVDTRPGDAHAVLVELFTSEGCSSCPPADALLEKLDDRQPVPGALLIVLSEHVDYWDHDGWKDPNSSPVLTERQGSYERALGASTPYTPQIIVDGTTEMRISDPQQVETTLRKAATTPKIAVRIGDVNVDGADGGVLRAHVDSDSNPEQRNADVYAAVALDRVESQVLHGENGGRHLTHVAVVQQLTKIGKLAKGKSISQDVQLRLKPGTDLKNVRLVIFVQEPGPRRLLGAGMRKPAS